MGRVVFWFSYNLLFHVVYLLMLPHFLLRMRRRGGYRKGFAQRLFRISETDRARLSEGRKTWVHAVSVGELNIGLAFMKAWRERHPEAQFLLTVNTSTAQAIARANLDPRDVLLYPPVDSPPVLSRLFATVDVERLVLVETEIWPNLLRAARRRDIPIVLLNGRVSDRSFARLRRIPWLTRRVYPLVSLFLMQSRRDAGRLASLGAPEERIRVLPSTKFDLAEADASEIASRREALLACGYLAEGSRVLLGSSTWPGEEAALARFWRERREGHPELRLILVPRHAERREEVCAELAGLGLKVCCWSAFAESCGAPFDVLLVDTTGELRHFTGLAEWVFVGKSLFRSEGQNPLEAAALGRAVYTGPGMDNFREVMDDLEGAEALRRVPDEAGLFAALGEALAHPGAAAEMGARAAALVRERQGGLAAAVREVEALS